MRGPTTKPFKRGFLKNLLLSLTSCRINGAASSSRAMSLQQRKRAVRLSADVAMATARGGGARWPQALLLLASSSSSPSWSSRPCRLLPVSKAGKRCTNMARRTCCHKRRRTLSSSSEIARRLVRKRTKVLRGLIPGGELLDGISLLHEAMDYVLHLQAQVAVLRRVANALQRPDMPSSGVLTPSAILKEETAQVSAETEDTL